MNGEKIDFSADDKRRAAERAARHARFEAEMAEGMKKEAEQRRAMMAEHAAKLADAQAVRDKEKTDIQQESAKNRERMRELNELGDQLDKI